MYNICQQSSSADHKISRLKFITTGLYWYQQLNSCIYTFIFPVTASSLKMTTLPKVNRSPNKYALRTYFLARFLGGLCGSLPMFYALAKVI